MNTTAVQQSLLRGFGKLTTTVYHGFALIGLAAVVFLMTRGIVFEEDGGRAVTFGLIRYDGPVSLVDRTDVADRSRALVSYLSRRYRIAPDATEHLVGAAYDAGQQVGLDPLLILAVMAIESRFNPIAESWVGAKGLMQVVPRHHQDKLLEHGGEQAMLDPMTNIFLGARILKEYIRRTGSLEAGLQFYNGALADPSSQYAQKVMAEKERLEQALRRFDRTLVRSAV
jgi:hypothetical protein